MTAQPPPEPTPPLRRDPMPQPPPEPDLDACCGQGCDPCVFDLHAAAMERFRAALAAWQARQAAQLNGGS